MANHPILRLKPREGRRARGGAPWIFSNEIVLDADAKSLAPGALVQVEGDDGRRFGLGMFNPGSLIAVRLLDAAEDSAIDRRFFAERMARALALREALYDKPYYRLVHAEGDRLPGLVVDRFGETCSLQITTAGMEALVESVVAALDDVVSPANVVLRADAPARSQEGLASYVRAVKGDAPHHLALVENGARYFADPMTGQKTGWYFDQRDNRAFMAELARGRTVLDLYCHSGGFAVLAAQADAREVHGIDSSAAALALATDGAAANAVSGVCRFLKADAMQELERLAGSSEQFDVVVCDPPPFVKSRKDLEAGARAYRKLARLAARIASRGGFLLLASCSHNMPQERFQAECAAGIARAGRSATLIRAAGAGPDHPVHPMLPETAYLKALVYALD
ncbi:MAG TPA: class I SAM-dependent rRNA methyltransferase [Rhizomicrobium sp.]|jgi:23S rRNA (cytosine1962-C5)-methyltransferase|nr:class I SAM-dependent rRNA methyltransferase [Rhizomicrobium sp.]